MLNRRRFASAAAASLACATLAPRSLEAIAAPPAMPASPVSFSVMLWALKGSFQDKLALVARAGYTHVELVDEYLKWSPEEWTRNLALLKQLGLTVDAVAGMKSGFATPAGGPGPNGPEAFLDELQSILPHAARLGCKQLILLSGKRVESLPENQQHDISVATLARAAKLLEQAGLTGVIEPIDRLENPTVYLDGVTEAFRIVRAVNSPSLRVLYDLYHEQRTHGNLLEKLQANLDLVGLIHVADVPGRHQPGTGELNFCPVYRALTQGNYRGVVAMEFYPTGDPASDLRAAREQALLCLANLSR